MAHNRYLRYRTSSANSELGEIIDLDGRNPVLFIEPRGHGVMKYPGPRSVESLKYVFAGRADDPEKMERADEIGYDLVPLLDAFWKRAVDGKGETFATESNYPAFAIRSEKTANKRSRSRYRHGSSVPPCEDRLDLLTKRACHGVGMIRLNVRGQLENGSLIRHQLLLAILISRIHSHACTSITPT